MEKPEFIPVIDGKRCIRYSPLNGELPKYVRYTPKAERIGHDNSYYETILMEDEKYLVTAYRHQNEEELVQVKSQVYPYEDSIDENGKLIKGKVGKDLNTEQAYQAAKRCGLGIISQAKNACKGDLSKIKSCVKLTGFVNSIDTFTEQPKVINGASDLMASIFGEIGMHTRAAVSTNSLPLGVAVEIDAIFELI